MDIPMTTRNIVVITSGADSVDNIGSDLFDPGEGLWGRHYGEYGCENLGLGSCVSFNDKEERVFRDKIEEERRRRDNKLASVRETDRKLALP